MFNYIKKTVCIVLVFVCLMSLISCSEKEVNGDEIVGTWKYEMNGKYRDVITEMIIDDMIYVDIYYEFNEDGTGKTYDTTGFTQEFEYEYKGDVITIISDGQSFDTPCSLHGNTLTITENGESVDFIKQ